MYFSKLLLSLETTNCGTNASKFTKIRNDFILYFLFLFFSTVLFLILLNFYLFSNLSCSQHFFNQETIHKWLTQKEQMHWKATSNFLQLTRSTVENRLKCGTQCETYNKWNSCGKGKFFKNMKFVAFIRDCCLNSEHHITCDHPIYVKYHTNTQHQRHPNTSRNSKFQQFSLNLSIFFFVSVEMHVV